jgi:tetratricopeptide (TPR) repeat protein
LDHAAARACAPLRTVYLHFRGKKRLRVKQTATMTERFQTGQRELDDLFERYRAAPGSHIFAPVADACRKAGMLDEALEICARGVGAHPRYASGYVVQGKCLYDAGRAGDAQAAFERVLDLDPKNLVALKYLGMLHAERGESDLACEYFEHILALDPDNREILSCVEDVELAGPRAPQASVRAEAETEMQTLTDVVTDMDAADDVDAQDEVAVLPDMEDDAFEGEPITLVDESVTSDEIATMTLADIYATQGYHSRALKIYREVLKRQPGNNALAAKIEALEKTVRAAIDAARTPEPAEPVAEKAKETPPPATHTPKPEATAPASSRPSAAQPSGTPINQSQSYEQFKRWLKASR